MIWIPLISLKSVARGVVMRVRVCPTFSSSGNGEWRLVTLISGCVVDETPRAGCDLNRVEIRIMCLLNRSRADSWRDVGRRPRGQQGVRRHTNHSLRGVGTMALESGRQKSGLDLLCLIHRPAVVDLGRILLHLNLFFSSVSPSFFAREERVPASENTAARRAVRTYVGSKEEGTAS
jgi:hypothetical protein